MGGVQNGNLHGTMFGIDMCRGISSEIVSVIVSPSDTAGAGGGVLVGCVVVSGVIAGLTGFTGPYHVIHGGLLGASGHIAG